MNTIKKLGSKNDFYRRAAWFSIIAPFATIFFVWLGSLVLFLSTNDNELHIQVMCGQFITGGAIITSLISFIMGVFGLFGESILIKLIAIFGIVVSGIVGFIAFLSFSYVGL